MKKIFSENWIILVIGIFLMTSMLLAIRNNDVIEKNHELQQQTELIRQRTQDILSQTMHGLDLGVRGYGLTKDKNMLRPYEEAIQKTPVIFRELDSLLQKQGYDDKVVFEAVQREVAIYISFSKDMIRFAELDSMQVFNQMLKQDKGYDVWKKYAAFADPLFNYEANLNKGARLKYRAAMRNNLLLQISIMLLAMPMLYMFIVKMRKERDGRTALLKRVEENDQLYVFNSGENHLSSSIKINETSIQNVKRASQFIDRMAEGDYEVNWEGLTEANRELNKDTLAGNLLQLRDKLKAVKQEDEKRNWINEGLAAFAKLIRTHQHDKNELVEKCTIYLTKYLKAQQAGLFLWTEEYGENYLTLAACYAFDRKKYIQKRINIGEGLIGQTFLEQEPVRLKEIPEGYTHITSGLGQATPRYLAIVPFKYDSFVPAIIELSSFQDLEAHHLQFLQKAGEHLASAIISSQTTMKMKVLLEEAASNEKMHALR